MNVEVQQPSHLNKRRHVSQCQHFQQLQTSNISVIRKKLIQRPFSGHRPQGFNDQDPDAKLPAGYMAVYTGSHAS